MHYVTAQTPDGDLHLIIDDHEVVRASGFGSVQELQKRLPAKLRADDMSRLAIHPYQKLVQAYYDGDRTALDHIPRQQDGSHFQQKAWSAISSVPYGKTISYKELAIAADNPGAVRAVGTACGQNRLILLVPCHRVLKSDGSIGNYLYGPRLKAALLSREQA